jgi:cell division protein ZapA (FtsZ GTPase activity inhibitor)
MSIVTITINNKQFQVGCNEGEEEMLRDAAAKLARRIDEIKESSPRAPTELLLIFSAIALQDENSELRSKLDRTGYGDDEKLSETLSTIAVYLDELAKKITK